MRKQEEGFYHTDEITIIDSSGNSITIDRGADIIALINSDHTIYTIAKKPESKYTIASSGRGAILL